MQTTVLPRIKLLPPLYFLFAYLTGFLLEYVYPSDLFQTNWFNYLGMVIIVTSFGLAIWSVRVFKHANTPMNVRRAAMSVVTQGPYALSRNPLYVSNLLLLTGLALVANQAWVLVSLVFILPIFHYQVIRQEEDYLSEKFGDEYRIYKNRVRCWI